MNFVHPRALPTALPRWSMLAGTVTVTALIAGCLGGGGDGGAAMPTASTTPVAVQVIDGAISNALVCLDKNANGQCDTGEPSGRTDTAGNVTLAVSLADAGKYPVLALVGTDAVDADHGPVATAFVMKTPADKAAVVSPLTTLVQRAVEATGSSSDVAAQLLQSQLGMNVSVFQDYTRNRTREGLTLAAVSRMVVVTQQQQAAELSSAVGTSAVDGTVITRADIDKLVVKRLSEILPSVIAAVANPAVQAAIDAGDIKQVNTALKPLAQAIVADPETGIKAAALSTLVAVNNAVTQGGNEAPTPTAGVQLHTLTYTDAQNWFRRLITSSTAQVVPDSNGLTRYRDNRLRSVGGVLGAWSFQATPDRQSDLHWNGQSWVQCGLLQESTATVRDAQGRNTYNYCDGYETGASTRVALDVAGKKLIDVYNQIRAAGYTNITIANAETALGQAVFPANAKALYYNGQSITTALTYIPNKNSIVRVSNSDALAAGTQADCNAITSQSTGAYTVEPATLEAMVARMQGKPCTYGTTTITGAGGAQLTSGSRNEFWSFAAPSIATVGTAATFGNANQATAYYTTNQVFRVAFGANKAITYYKCLQRWDGSVRNCDSIGTGTYEITTVGDARVMTLGNPPPQLATVTYDRVFVERAGKVYFGYKSKPTAYSQARFNLEGANAFIGQLSTGPQVTVESTVVLTPASWAGDWIFWASSDPAAWNSSNAGVVRIQPNFNGTSGYQCFDAIGNATTTAFTCTVTLDSSGALTVVDSTSTMSATLRFVEGTATGSSLENSVTTPVLGARR